MYKKYHKCWNVGMKKRLLLDNNFQWRDYFVVQITQTAQSRPSEYPGHKLIV